ncbi:hypothetical protein BpHYR1_005870 [Brachionus plicatilis]|uniref:Uncharacterized protein n=1 Tax=Brachionus plicatilis TaxID=10195 RepID=A0A3M7TAF1_BRAPC|nr:hypothetical protein BpHYR1_005870 [Brachionus plicatilis]
MERFVKTRFDCILTTGNGKKKPKFHTYFSMVDLGAGTGAGVCLSGELAACEPEGEVVCCLFRGSAGELSSN